MQGNEHKKFIYVSSTKTYLSNISPKNGKFVGLSYGILVYKVLLFYLNLQKNKTHTLDCYE